MKTTTKHADDTHGVFIPIQRESPAERQHLHTMQAGAWLPAAQATITGMIVGMAVLTAAIIFRWRDPWKWGVLVGVGAWGFTWVTMQRHWLSLTALEEVTGLDLNGDGTVGRPESGLPVEESPRVIRVHMDEVRDNGYWRQTRFDLHATDEQMRELAEGLLAHGRTFSVREWTGAGRPFSVEQFNQLRTDFIRHQLVAAASEKDPRRGYVITEAGRAVLHEFITDLSV
jgi:hypothetical protein